MTGGIKHAEEEEATGQGNTERSGALCACEQQAEANGGRWGGRPRREAAPADAIPRRVRLSGFDSAPVIASSLSVRGCVLPRPSLS